MTALVALFAFAMFAFGLWMSIKSKTGPQSTMGNGLVIFSSAVLFAILLLALPAHARDDGRYAQSQLKPWFDGLKSEKGPVKVDIRCFMPGSMI